MSVICGVIKPNDVLNNKSRLITSLGLELSRSCHACGFPLAFRKGLESEEAAVQSAFMRSKLFRQMAASTPK